MSTGEQSVLIQQKRILGLEDFKGRFFDYLNDKIIELFALTYNVGGVYGSTLITFTASGNDQFDLDPAIPATDGEGHVLTLTSALASDVQFENTAAIPYFVGLRYATFPVGVQINPRTGLPEFQRTEDSIGDEADPDAVVDLGATMELTVDSVTEAAVNCAGRLVKVYLKTPESNMESVAIETATVTWDGFNNKIVTVAQFGQSAPSTTPADYRVVLLGPTVKRNTDLSVDPNNAFIGTVTGAGAGNPPGAFVTTSQNLIDTTFTGIDDITRTGTNGDLKVSVDAHVADVGEAQMEVLDGPGGVSVFSVDEAGNVVIDGNLSVQGTETVQNTVTNVANNIVGDNLTAGDADGDTQLFQGDLSHTSDGFGGPTFSIDGATGDITIPANILAIINMLGTLRLPGDNSFTEVLKLGASLIGTDADAIIPRLQTDLKTGGANDKTLIWQSDGGGGARITRLYASAAGLTLAMNAVWSNATNLWDHDDDTIEAQALNIGLGFANFKTKNSGVATWGDASVLWDGFQTFSVDEVNAARVRVRDAITEPAAPLAGRLYKNNQVIGVLEVNLAAGVITVIGTGTFNIEEANLSFSGNNFHVDFLTPAAHAEYGVSIHQIVGAAVAPAAFGIVSPAISGFNISAWDLATPTQLNLSTVAAMTMKISVMGEL